MQPTERDAQIVEWLGRIGAAGVEHLMARFDMAESTAARRLRMLIADGLVDHQVVLYKRPGVYWATRRGLHWRGLTRMQVFSVTPGGYEHVWQLANVAVALESSLPGWRAIYDREIKRLEADEGKLIASVKVGASARSMLHRPDLLLVAPTGRLVAVEVELTDKGPRRLEQICRGWTRARHIDHVYYLAEPRPRRTTTRAVKRTLGEDMITVLESGDVAGIVERELSSRPSADPAPPAFPGEADEGLDLWPWEREVAPRPNRAPMPQAVHRPNGLDLLPCNEE